MYISNAGVSMLVRKPFIRTCRRSGRILSGRGEKGERSEESKSQSLAQTHQLVLSDGLDEFCSHTLANIPNSTTATFLHIPL